MDILPIIMVLLLLFGFVVAVKKLFQFLRWVFRLVIPKKRKAKINNNKSVNSISLKNSEDDDDDDEFGSFTVSYGFEESVSKNKKKGVWIPLGKSVKIKGYAITRGNFYMGGQLPALDGMGTDAALVDSSLKVKKQPIGYTDDSLGYWPKYNSISERCRGAYLQWLSSDRSDPDAPIGYIFLYFYGLERRVLVDSISGQVDDQEFTNLFEEIKNLRKLYSNSRSLMNYSTRLLEVMCVLRPELVSFLELEKNPKQDSILLPYRIAKVVGEGLPISADLALAWLKYTPEYKLRQPARRCAIEFNQLFHRFYTKKHSDGIVVKPNKTRLRVEYRPASSSLRGVNIPHSDLPDPTSLKGPIKKLINIAEKCTEDLDAYSRYLGKANTSRNDIKAVLLLPKEFVDVDLSPVLIRVRRWADERVLNSDGLVEVDEFWQVAGLPSTKKINKKEVELMQSLTERIGFGFAPDARYHHAKPSIDGKFVLFEKEHGKYFEPSQAYDEMILALRLGALIATIDSSLDKEEISLLEKLIDHDTNLSPVEKRSLNAYLIWRLNTASNLAGLKASLQNVGDKEKTAVSKILLGIAVADGKVDTDEIRQLEKLYGLLGLDKSKVAGDIHSYTTGNRAPVSKQPHTKMQSDDKSAPAAFELDERVLAIHESQTKDVQAMLSTIFVDEELVEDAASKVDEEVESESMGIDAQHYALYESLINKDKWSSEEVENMCKEMGLMKNAAIETINDWSYEKVDAPVLEDEADDLYVDQDIVEELER